MEEAKDVPPPSSGLEIVASVAQKVTFATQQNDVPVIVELAVRNHTDDVYENLSLHISSDTNLVATHSWRLDRIAARSEIHISDRQVRLDGARLGTLNERLLSRLTLELRQADTVLASSEYPVIGLAKNEWGGAQFMPELLAAFITPNDPAVARILKDAGEALRRSGLQPSLNGYQSGSRRLVWQLVAAIWTAISEKRFVYAEPPASFELEGQKIRLPSTILEDGLMTCLDSALLFCACIEQAGLNPIVIFTKGHAFCGAWLQPLQLPTMTIEDPLDLRKLVSLNDVIVFETTLAVHEPAVQFNKAILQAQRLISEENEGQFVYALDVRRARSRQIFPLPADGAPGTASSQPESSSPSYSVDSAPDDLPGFDLDIRQSPGPDTPETRLDHWRRKLLDLTKRNRLLNLRPSKTAITLRCHAPDILEDKLADGTKISVIPMPKPNSNSRDAELFRGRTGDDLKKRFVEEALARNEVVADLDEEQLEAGLVELYRKAKSDLAEGGANTLFLALGMLRWKQKDEEQIYRAPLILLPVTLERKSAKSKVRIVHHDDSPVFNMTLLEMLKRDFELELPSLRGELPKDEHGVDVPLIWNQVRQAVRDVPGFEMTEDVVLSTFSFAKYLMWKDLTDRTEQLRNSALVRHLIDSPRQAYTNSADFVKAHEIDQKLDPKDLYMPLTADASQITAVHASTLLGDFVLEGPPGTGKSQTIANIIAQNLALGKRVLFVSEKMAALEVVYKRLKDVGLGDFCLELHSNKANKKEVLNQLGLAWHNRQTVTQQGWLAHAGKLKDARDGLNRYVEALHDPSHSGVSPFAAIGRAVRFRDLTPIRFDWTGDLAADPFKSRPDYERAVDLVKQCGVTWNDISAEDKASFGIMGQTDWSMEWQRSVIESARKLLKSGRSAGNAALVFAAKLSVNIPLPDLAAYADLSKIAEQVPIAAGHNLSFGLGDGGAECLSAIEKVIGTLEEYRRGKPRLSIEYSDDAIRSAPWADWQRLWEDAGRRWAPVRFLKQRAIRKSVAQFARSRQRPNVPNDIAVLQSMQPWAIQLEQFGNKFPKVGCWLGPNTDISQLSQYAKACEEIRGAVSRLCRDLSALPALRVAFHTALVDNREHLAEGQPIGRSAHEYLSIHREFAGDLDRFSELCALASTQHLSFDALETAATSVIDRAQRLKLWCQWQAVAKRAQDARLESVVSALEVGDVTADLVVSAFETAYSIWLAERLIDDREELRKFSAQEHIEKIRNFVELDSRQARLSVDFIRAKLSAEIPDPDSSHRPVGYAILARELQKKIRHKPIRELIGEMGTALTDLTPCLMMSPLSVAQFLSADSGAMFDLVVFDEASQITVWDAIGAIARGKNAIVVGDPKQMPPTNFFDRSAGEEEDQNAADLESILDEAMATGVKWHRLTGHYRSRHESLIAFSNHRYYEGDLVTYPSSDTKESSVHLRLVQGLYQRGSGRTNPDEAKALVKELVMRLRKPEYEGRSIGVVTLNSEQQRLIDNLLDDERRRDPALERHFSDDIEEPVFVKNLETVQGDQRDVILLSIGYGPDTPGAPTMSMNFGPLNRVGGERRLNVAITRATTEVVIFASFDPSMIDLTRTSSSAVRDLKHYMEFAQRGPKALGEAIQSIGGYDQYDSDFESAVAEALRNRGWTVQTQIGISKFRIDLGIVHPDRPGMYLAGIECDGATYHSLPSARDRDRVRQSILESLGWKLIRIWSTDYFVDPRTTMEKVHRALTALLEQSRAAVGPDANETDDLTTETAGFVLQEDTHVESGQVRQAPAGAAPRTSTGGRTSGSLSNAGSVRLDAGRFYEDHYRSTIRTYATHLIDKVGPITFDHLSEKIARAHGFQRTGKQIKSQIWRSMSSIRVNTRTPDGHTVFWSQGISPSITVPYRGLNVEGEERTWHQVPHPEKLAAAVATIKKSSGTDLVDRLSRDIGVARLTQPMREELEKLLEAATQHLG